MCLSTWYKWSPSVDVTFISSQQKHLHVSTSPIRWWLYIIIHVLYFQILYTHQKQKKAKTWHDGVLKHSGHGMKVSIKWTFSSEHLMNLYVTLLPKSLVWMMCFAQKSYHETWITFTLSYMLSVHLALKFWFCLFVENCLANHFKY